MDNVSRSGRTRAATLQAALTIIARDGPGRLTLDAIAREGGMSKGAVMHHFHNKEAVLRALLDRQTGHFAAFQGNYMAEHAGASAEPNLAAEIATMREFLKQPDSAAFAMLGAIAENPDLLSGTRDLDAAKLSVIKAEAGDPDLATLRWLAARGILVTTLIGMCPLSEAERDRLFDRLIDDKSWSGPAISAVPEAGARGRRARTQKPGGR